VHKLPIMQGYRKPVGLGEVAERVALMEPGHCTVCSVLNTTVVPDPQNILAPALPWVSGVGAEDAAAYPGKFIRQIWMKFA